MANLVPDGIRGLLSKYTFQIDHKTNNDDLLCVVCKRLMIDAYQSHCGCQYCHDCIVKYLSERDKYCCGGKRQCNDELLVLESNVGRSILLNRKISRVRVNCPNKSCTHNAELTEMEQHLRVCTKPSIECPYVSIGCDNERADKDKILTHLHNDTLAHTQLLIKNIHDLKNEVEQLKEDLKIKEIQIDELINEVTTLKKCNKLVSEKSRNIKTASTLGRQWKTYDGETVETKTFMREESDERDLSVFRRRRIDRLEATIERIIIQMNAAEVVGTTVFTLDRFSKRKTTTESVYSPYFYSHTNGYKLRLRVDPGGHYDEKDPHLTVFIIICKGEYDDQLSWPCKHTFTVSIVNQNNKDVDNTMIFSLFTASDNRKYCYNKPTNNDNDGHGCARFISHENLRSIVGVIVDDCIVIKCVVTAPS